MSIYALKPKFQNLLRPIVKRLYQKGITANQVTLFACAVSILLGLLLALFAGVSTLFWLLPIWLFVRMALNAMDGMLAREFGQQSALGGYLNEITDIAARCCFCICLLPLSHPSAAYKIALFIWLAAMTEFAAFWGKFMVTAGVMTGHSAKATVHSLSVHWQYGMQSPAASIRLSNILMWLACAALVYTCYKRVINGLKAV